MANYVTNITLPSPPVGNVLITQGATTVSSAIGPIEQAVIAAAVAAQMGNYMPGGTAGNINASTAQGIALVQSLIFGS